MNEKIQSYNQVLTNFICALVIISNFSYYPFFQASSYARPLVIAAWLVLLAYSLIRLKALSLKVSIAIVEIVLFVIFVLNSAVTTIVSNNDAFANHFFMPVSVAMAIFIIGYFNGEVIGLEGLKRICKTYMHSMFVIAVLLMIFYLRFLDFTSLFYEYKYGKNEISMLLLIACIFFVTIYSPSNFIGKLYKMAAIVMIVVDLTFIKSRSSILGLPILYFTVVLFAKKLKTAQKIILVAIPVTLFIFISIYSSVWNFLIDNIVYVGRGQGSIDDISSGRITQVSEGWRIFQNDFTTGKGAVSTIDCFFISALANYGLGAWPVIIMSIIPLVWAVIKRKLFGNMSIAFLAIAMSLLVLSIFEELAPFGSGTRCYAYWLLWGILLRISNGDEHEKSI